MTHLDPRHMQAVHARIAQLQSPEMSQRLEGKVERINARIPGASRGNLIEQAFRSSSNAKRLMWLRKEADITQKAAEPESACRAGCSHCCHINVLVPEPEARVIAKEIGLHAPAQPDPRNILITGDYASDEGMAKFQREKETRHMSHFGQPCPFLLNNQCSIYSFRPMVCRQQISLDDDELLCRLVDGESIPVPYLNQQISQAAQLILWGPQTRLADIRDWFPNGLSD